MIGIAYTDESEEGYKQVLSLDRKPIFKRIKKVLTVSSLFVLLVVLVFIDYRLGAKLQKDTMPQHKVELETLTDACVSLADQSDLKMGPALQMLDFKFIVRAVSHQRAHPQLSDYEKLNCKDF